MGPHPTVLRKGQAAQGEPPPAASTTDFKTFTGWQAFITSTSRPSASGPLLLPHPSSHGFPGSWPRYCPDLSHRMPDTSPWNLAPRFPLPLVDNSGR